MSHLYKTGFRTQTVYVCAVGKKEENYCFRKCSWKRDEFSLNFMLSLETERDS